MVFSRSKPQSILPNHQIAKIRFGKTNRSWHIYISLHLVKLKNKKFKSHPKTKICPNLCCNYFLCLCCEGLQVSLVSVVYTYFFYLCFVLFYFYFYFTGKLEILKYLHENGCEWDYRTTKFAADISLEVQNCLLILILIFGFLLVKIVHFCFLLLH